MTHLLWRTEKAAARYALYALWQRFKCYFNKYFKFNIATRSYKGSTMKRRYFIVLLALFLMPFTAEAFTGSGCGGDCNQCHALEKRDAERILKKLAPAGVITGVKLSPVGGLWQVDMDVNGQRGIYYIDFGKKHVLLGQSIRIIPIEDAGKPPEKKVNFSKLPLTDAIVLGPKKAAKKVAVFTDPDCPYCRKFHEEMKQLLAKRNDVAFYIFLRPLAMHKDAYKKAQAVLCEKSLTLLDDAFSGKPLPEPSCSKERVDKNIALADSLGFSGTPMIVRDDGTVMPGYIAADRLSAWIDKKK
jgi:thiol:disulfide interchange protein DsbC